jgi:transglutaminase-like putative cysteine protease
MKKFIPFLLWLVAIAITSTAIAQDTDLWQSMKSQYPEEPAVFLERSEVLSLFVEGDSLRIFNDVNEDIMHLKEQTEAYSGRKVYGSHFSHVADIRAKTLVWEKNRYREVDVSDFKKNSDRDRGIFYDDSYYYSFDFPAVASRNRTQLAYRELQKDPRFLSGFMFVSYLPQAKTTYTIKTTRDVELVYQVLNDPDKKVKFRKSEKGKNIIYEWSAENLPSVRTEDESPSVRYFAPHLVCYVKSYQANAKKINVLSGINDLYKWYYGFVKDLNGEVSPQLASITEQLKKESKSDLDMVRKVFYWVQDNIQYIAFEQGMRGLIPHNGAYTCDKRYGDCKDMANLIVNMLQLAGVKSYHTWIGTRDLPYKYSELPTPLVDNHMIATYISNDGQYYFLDATSDYTPFGYPSSMIQGKEALISKGPDAFEIKLVPVLPREQNVMTDSMAVVLQENAIAGHGISTLTGYPKVFGGYELDRAEKDDVRKYVTKLVGKGSNKFFLDDYEVTHLNDREKPTTVKYEFRVLDYFQKIDDEIYINLNLNKDYYNTFINSETRKSPREADYQYVKHEVISLQIPPGYEVSYIPETARHDGTQLGYEIRYHVKGNEVIYTKMFYLNFLLLKPENFAAWNESVKRVSESYKESIILKKKSQ